ncbi:ethylene receptor-like protein [Carex littledalei]|uniref:Ethylene receptor-like protein n=1 Tax=Carex littledalei TaxID=544730 RepID=A0A833RJN2_9POAL|nr:ethylene receptor-like protein [Carex littledalei]
MEGHIWLESEGLGKGCTASFIVKLGSCDNNPCLYQQQQILPVVWSNQSATDGSAMWAPPPPPSKDEKLIVPAKNRYQRSI